jgi:uncharacterized protein
MIGMGKIIRKHVKTGLLIAAVLFVLLANTGIACAEPVPARPFENIYVFDYAGLIDDADEQQMRKIAELLEEKSKAQLIVVTINDLAQMEIEDYALELFRNWGIGDKEKNNGLLILVNKESLLENRRGRIRIEVGYGLEGAINDGKAGAILDTYALPAFELGEYSRGIRDTFMVAAAEVAKEYGLDLEDENFAHLKDYPVEDEEVSLLALLPIIIVVVIFLITIRKTGGPRGYHRGPFTGTFFGSGHSRGGGFGGGSTGGGGASR